MKKIYGDKFNCNCWGLKKYAFDVSQLNSNICFAARGAIATSPSHSTPVDNPIVGGFQFKSSHNTGRGNS